MAASDHRFYSQTFWGNIAVFRCCQAAQALAKRGLNVVRLFIGLSSGGVGQSLYSTHLQAMYGHNFAFFDPNIWFNEEEMRKQVEQLNGCCILTGQESPGTNRRLREDLFKKFASADGISGRKPYGFKTRMIHCIGWKRLEANRMFSFTQVDKKKFNAIMRRSLVWRVKARFEDPQVIANTYEDIYKDGIFARDPDLHDFLTSSPAAAAGLQLQHAFEAEHSKQQCLDIIEDYVVFGGDSGLTETTMREACGLPPRNLRDILGKMNGVINLDEPEEDKQEIQWRSVREAIVAHLLESKKISITKPSLTALRFAEGPNVSRQALVEGLCAMRCLLECPAKTRSKCSFLPCLNTEKDLQNIVQHQNRICDVEYPEVYHIKSFQSYLTKYPCRRENAMTLANVFKTARTKKQKKGTPTAQEKQIREIFLANERKLEDAEKHGDSLLDSLQIAQKVVKRRRMQKSPSLPVLVKLEDDNDPSSSDVVCKQCTYHYTHPESVRTRKQVSGVGSQSFSRRAQLTLLQGTHDLDMKNCVFTLLMQLLDKLDLRPPLPADLKQVFEECTKKRDTVCSDILHLPLDEGKQVLVSILYGGPVPEELKTNEFLNKMVKLSLYLRWAAVSLLRSEFELFAAEGSGKRNPESSCLFHLYAACEDFVLSAWTEFLVSTYKPRHLSLHFDGVRISPVEGISVEEICHKSEEHIAKKCGFHVAIREKHHHCVLQLLKQNATKVDEPLFEESDILREAGNCIPHALACLKAIGASKFRLLTQKGEPNNVYMQQRGCRTYRQCSEMFGCKLHATIYTDGHLPSGAWLLHVENGALPHCVAVRREPDSRVTVWDIDAVPTVSEEALLSALRSGVDSRTCVHFTFEHDSKSTVGEEAEELALDLAAGAVPAEVVIMDSDDEEEQFVEKDAQGFEWLDLEAVVTVDSSLAEELEQEVLQHIHAARSGTIRKRQGEFPCPACPFRSFGRSKRLVEHLQRYHTKKRGFCCSGTKQVRVILALHDSDMLQEKKCAKFLQRSAAVLRKSIRPSLSSRNNKVDAYIRLVLDSSGPKLVHANSLKGPDGARRLTNGKVWFTHSFAERLFQEMLLHRAKAG